MQIRRTQIHGSQIKDETIDGSQIKDNTIGTEDIKDGSILDEDIAIDAAVNADKLADGDKNKVFTSEERVKLASIKAAELSIPVGENFVIWNHNFGSKDYAINVIPDQSSINVYFTNKTDESIEIRFYEILGTTMDAYASYDRTKPVNIDVTLIPSN